MRLALLLTGPSPASRPGAAADGLAGGWAWLRIGRLLSGKAVLACADQAVVSGTSFLSLIMVARWTDAGQLGAFALGTSVLGVLLIVQYALVSLPYVIQHHSPPVPPREYAFCCLLQGLLLSAVAIVGLAAGALALAATGADPLWVNTAWALAAVTPFVLGKEFARDFAFARLELRQALALDAVSAAIQIGLIAWLGLTGQLSPLLAYAAIGASSGVAALGWLAASRSRFAPRGRRLATVIRQNWILGKWLFLSKSAVLVQGYSTYWLTLLVAGSAVTGIFAACISIVALANPLVIGLYNFLAPRSVVTWRDGGGAALRNQTIRDATLLGSLMGVFCFLVLGAGEHLMRLLYPGEEFSDHGRTVAVLALAALVTAVGTPAGNALASMERPRPVAAVAAVAAALNVPLVWWMMSEWGLLGAALAILAANVVGTVGRWAVFLTLVRQPRSNPMPDGGHPNPPAGIPSISQAQERA